MIQKTTEISPCGKYRYTLGRAWDLRKPMVLFVMLNPSTADADIDDPTIKRCIAFAKDWGFGSIFVVNLFAFRATDPEEMLKAPAPVGIFNDEYLSRTAQEAAQIVLAWGTRGGHLGQDKHVYRMLREYGLLWGLGLTAAGFPKHPLYVKRDTELQPYLISSRIPEK